MTEPPIQPNLALKGHNPQGKNTWKHEGTQLEEKEKRGSFKNVLNWN